MIAEECELLGQSQTYMLRVGEIAVDAGDSSQFASQIHVLLCIIIMTITLITYLEVLEACTKCFSVCLLDSIHFTFVLDV
jgi:transcriptional regulatory protein LevR